MHSVWVATASGLISRPSWPKEARLPRHFGDLLPDGTSKYDLLVGLSILPAAIRAGLAGEARLDTDQHAG